MDRTNSGSIDISVHMHKLKKSEVVHYVLLLRLHVKIDNFALFSSPKAVVSPFRGLFHRPRVVGF